MVLFFILIFICTDKEARRGRETKWQLPATEIHQVRPQSRQARAEVGHTDKYGERRISFWAGSGHATSIVPFEGRATEMIVSVLDSRRLFVG